MPVGRGGSPITGPPVKPAPSTKKGKTLTRKKSGTPAQPLYRQPLFDKRIRTLAWPMQGGLHNTGASDFGAYELHRGLMVWDKAVAPYTGQAEVNFLFNPTTITTSYSMDATDVSASLLYRAPGDTAQAAFAMNQSVSVALYFDRTFELWGGYDPLSGLPRNQQGPAGYLIPTYDVTDPSVYGVNVDILAFKQLTGQLLAQYSAFSTAAAGSANPASNTGYVPGISQQGVGTMRPTWLYLGPDTGLVYYGYVSDFTVTVTDWTQFMIPKRCVINFNFALMMPPGNEPKGPKFTDWMLLSEIKQDLSPGSQSPSGKAGR
jgi:hypothetical protein